MSSFNSNFAKTLLFDETEADLLPKLTELTVSIPPSTFAVAWYNLPSFSTSTSNLVIFKPNVK